MSFPDLFLISLLSMSSSFFASLPIKYFFFVFVSTQQALCSHLVMTSEGSLLSWLQTGVI
jgi:hypothetical protein